MNKDYYDMPLTVEYVLDHGIYVSEPYNYVVFLEEPFMIWSSSCIFFIPDELADKCYKYILPPNIWKNSLKKVV